MNLPGLFRGKKKSRPRKKTKKASRPAYLPWVLGGAVVVIMAGVGLMKWSDTRTGQAALLSMGSQKMYGEVQLAVDQALTQVFPEFLPGPANAAARDADPGNFDWPAPELGPGAHVRCRLIAVPADIPYRSLELQVVRALEPLGARVLWGQRLYPDRPAGSQLQPDEQADHLRLDLGVPGKPTHTVVLYRKDSEPSIRWGFGAEMSAWSRLSAHGQNPVVALVIDDWGYGKTQATRELLALPVPLTMAVLPGLSYSREFSLAKTDLVLPPDQLEGAAGQGQSSAPGRVERLAAGCFVEVATGPDPKRLPERRREILLHLPMEPQGYPDPDPGPQAVMVGMGQTDIEARLVKALAGLDRVTGVNNHMGSAATSDPATMKNLMDALQERGLLFLDSLTSASSVAYETALAGGIPALQNRIFLDYDNEDEQKIAAHLHALVKAARAGGFAVGIGHPHPATARVLTREVPRLAAQGVVFVTVSELYALQQQREGTLP